MMVTLKMRTRMETAETVIMRVRSRVICSGVTTAASTAAVAASCVSALTACSSGLVVSILPVSLVQDPSVRVLSVVTLYQLTCVRRRGSAPTVRRAAVCRCGTAGRATTAPPPPRPRNQIL